MSERKMMARWDAYAEWNKERTTLPSLPDFPTWCAYRLNEIMDKYNPMINPTDNVPEYRITQAQVNEILDFVRTNISARNRDHAQAIIGQMKNLHAIEAPEPSQWMVEQIEAIFEADGLYGQNLHKTAVKLAAILPNVNTRKCPLCGSSDYPHMCGGSSGSAVGIGGDQDPTVTAR
jgi:hypothetical protein